ncbi:MAG TPA: acyl carrier protein [Puia sp.]|jgi:acyl carrier protein|nr:acyl carrier protein [Puia sp.]
MASASDQIKLIMHEKLGIDIEKLRDDADFKDDLGVDSLDLIELRLEIEKRFSVNMPEEIAENLKTVGSLIEFVNEKKK